MRAMGGHLRGAMDGRHRCGAMGGERPERRNGQEDACGRRRHIDGLVQVRVHVRVHVLDHVTVNARDRQDLHEQIV